MVLIVLSETPVMLAVSSNNGLLGPWPVSSVGCIRSIVIGIPLMRTPAVDPVVRSIETVTRTSSSAGSSGEWAKRRMSILGARAFRSAVGAWPTNEVQNVEGVSLPDCVFTVICISQLCVEDRPNSTCRLRLSVSAFSAPLLTIA